MKLLCKIGIHFWEHRETIGGINRLRYLTRKCRRCGREQIKKRGPAGDGKWYDLEGEWLWSWERDDFLAGRENEPQ